jgi:hypothetical protein
MNSKELKQYFPTLKCWKLRIATKSILQQGKNELNTINIYKKHSSIYETARLVSFFEFAFTNKLLLNSKIGYRIGHDRKLIYIQFFHQPPIQNPEASPAYPVFGANCFTPDIYQFSNIPGYLGLQNISVDGIPDSLLF